jgi:hypothetical protein
MCDCVVGLEDSKLFPNRYGLWSLAPAYGRHAVPPFGSRQEMSADAGVRGRTRQPNDYRIGPPARYLELTAQLAR